MRDDTKTTPATPTYRTEDGVELHEGDRAFDYYSMKPGRIGSQAGSSGDWASWFDFHHDDGGRQLLNGARICTIDYARRRGFPGA